MFPLLDLTLVSEDRHRCAIVCTLGRQGPVSLYIAQGVAYVGASSFVHGSDVVVDHATTDVFHGRNHTSGVSVFPPQSIYD